MSGDWDDGSDEKGEGLGLGRSKENFLARVRLQATFLAQSFVYPKPHLPWLGVIREIEHAREKI